ncbi:hypothetical protein Pelo_1019 [Pelomyxa schiedti]|nr:hypothetical protein Pelo_1019 [Pelomyxa schiedti]
MKVSYRIGGREGEGDSTTWNALTNWNDPGWEMRFDVEEGRVSGGNTNDAPGLQRLKLYTGTLVDGHLDITSNHGVRYVADIVVGEMCTVEISHNTSSALGRGRVSMKTG